MDGNASIAGTLESGAASEPRLLVDAMLGRLARRLRLLGYDAEYAGDVSDAEIVRRARLEGRIIVTRDRDLVRRRGVRTLAVISERLPEQLAQVARAYPLVPEKRALRCGECNAALRHLSAEEARDRVLPTSAAPRRVPGVSRLRPRLLAGTHWTAIAESCGQP